ncbi:MAG: magnesium/cobalt transporter CorA [Candidatus Omnitrophica bacterium]|nr:magnesium/cobalt transporter CorA [Candidatus Omnitrophota bacterium]
MIRSYVYRVKEQRLDKDVPFDELAQVIEKGEDRIWLDFEDKLEDEEVDLLSGAFGLHALAIEDCIMVNTRAKVEAYDGYIFVVLHAARKDLKIVDIEQVELDIFLGKQFLISVHQGSVAGITAIEERLQRNPHQLLGQGTDRFFHAIYDRLVDNYFPLMDRVDDEIDEIEDCIVKDPRDNVIGRMVELRKELVSLRRVLSPLRETTQLLTRENFNNLLSENVRIYFRDVYDHIARILDLIDSYRDAVSTAFETYHFMISNRTNDIMRTLTTITTIMLPLTVITGVYGMNFKFMPELEHPFGYLGVLAFMAVLSLGMLAYFRRQHWL